MNERNLAAQVVTEVKKAIVGKDAVLVKVLAAVLARGHILLEDIPGVGKTTLALAFAKALNLQFSRVQFTPDVMPSDITGFSIYNKETGKMTYQPGAVMCNLFLADELNRATSRTQSALLEAMEERQVTVDGVTTKLEEPFLVMATQNPLESFGTFPLPDAQLDRFFMRLSLGYMTREQEMAVMARPSTQSILDTLEQAVTPEETAYVRAAFTEVKVAGDVLGYLMDIVEATRQASNFTSGVSTRGGIALYKASQVTAALRGREYVIPEDVKYAAPFVLAHRLTLGGGLKTGAAERMLRQILEDVAVPLESV